MDRFVNRLTTGRISGWVGAGAGALFLLLLAWEHTAQLQPSAGPMVGPRLWNQIGFLVAMIGYIIMLTGVHRSRAAGGGRFGRIGTWTFLSAWTLLGLCSLLTASGLSQDDNPLLPVAALLLLVGALLTGIAIARAGVWRGWRRWWPLGLAIYWPVASIVTDSVASEPSFAVEAVWALTYVGLGLASATSATDASEEELGSATLGNAGPESAQS